ncbi:glycoside hydrolase family 15 protein [Variovorax sp. PvP013]|uniref:glycoside hydrolase family 15 protein n=1 Tax=Variovorax sp. PvP013 TaxID=3156435 RepID=UPI003D19E179
MQPHASALNRRVLASSKPNERPITDHALIGDMRGAALVANDAMIDWLCLERFDADPVFAGLLDTGIGGACSVHVEGGVVSKAQRYRARTNILETSLRADTGAIVVCDFMPVHALSKAGPVGPDSESRGRLIRLIRCEAGTVNVQVRVQPGFDWGRRTVVPLIAGKSADYGDQGLYVTASHDLAADGPVVTCSVTLQKGEHLTVILSQAQVLEAGVSDAQEHLIETERYWQHWNARGTYRGPYESAVERSALCLKLLTYAPTGAMIAAPTTGLPEVAGGIRNWDYRFVWTRDASFSVSAFLNLGHRREAAEFLRFLQGACHGGEAVRVMYTVEGKPAPDEVKMTHLAGWKGSTPIPSGNGAVDQKQHEIYGELLAALNSYISQHGTEGLCASLVSALPDFVSRLCEEAIQSWPTPDQGIWELPGRPRHMLHSKAMCWVAVDRAIALAPRIGLEVPLHWPEQRHAIKADCLQNGWNERAGTFVMEYGGTDLDMSLLRLTLMDMVPANDPRMTATLKALQQELGHDDLYRRYRFDDGLPGEEGAFAACSYWVVAVLAESGETAAAVALFQQLSRRSNHVGLYAEEFDIPTGAQLGNFPQAFTHMALIHEAVRLASIPVKPVGS